MNRPSKRPLGQILPGLFLGRMAAVRKIFELQGDDNNQNDQEEWTVVSILSSASIISTVTDTLETEQRKFGRKLVVRHEIWDLPDKANADFVSDRLIEVLTVVSKSIEMPATPTPLVCQRKRPRRNCLIHCARGVSRSAAVCAAWLISCGGYTLSESFDLIRATREVNPNLGFLAGLRAIEKCGGDVKKAQQRLTRKKNKKQEESPSAEHGVPTIQVAPVVPDASDEVSC